MILTFERKTLLQIVNAVENGTGHKVPYTGDGWSRPLETTPGLLLVGDEGVYLLGNNDRGPNEPFHVAYANEANPKRMGFYEYRQVKEASFGGDDGCMFLDLQTVKSQMLVKAIPFIDLTPESYALGCADTLDELFEEPIEKPIPVIEIGDIAEMVEADYEETEEDEDEEKEYGYFDDEDEPLISWRHYRASAPVPFDFAVREMCIDPEEYDYENYNLKIDIYMNPQNLWAKIELDGYGELHNDQMDYAQVDYKGTSLSSIAVGDMFTWHAGVEEDLSENGYRITCEFNPDRLPNHLDWDGFQKVFKDALAEISPKSTLSFKAGEYYRFHDHGHYDDAYLQFLVYKWIMENRAQLEPQRWLTIHSGESHNCFNGLISEYYGWPTCEIHGYM